MGEKTEGVIRWKYGDAEHVSHSNKNKKMLHARACFQGMSCHAMGGHPVSKISKKPYNPARFFLLLFLFFFHSQTFFQRVNSVSFRF